MHSAKPVPVFPPEQVCVYKEPCFHLLAFPAACTMTRPALTYPPTPLCRMAGGTEAGASAQTGLPASLASMGRTWPVSTLPALPHSQVGCLFPAPSPCRRHPSEHVYFRRLLCVACWAHPKGEIFEHAACRSAAAAGPCCSGSHPRGIPGHEPAGVLGACGPWHPTPHCQPQL